MFAATVPSSTRALPTRLTPPPALAPAAPKPPAANEAMSLVNLAARQRMLSQRMVLQTVLAASGSTAHLQAAQKSFQLFCESQVRLLATGSELDAPSAQQVRNTYRGPQGVGQRIDDFMAQMRATLDALEKAQPHERALAALVQSTDGVLDALNVATTTFDNISKHKSSLLMRELTDIVTEIQTVAREAKVVSFNAQVMAARAGQHGREFAVVANVLSGITVEIDGMSRKAMDLVARNKPH
jgi:methyl-accepting chemotaxis protein